MSAEVIGDTGLLYKYDLGQKYPMDSMPKKSKLPTTENSPLTALLPNGIFLDINRDKEKLNYNNNLYETCDVGSIPPYLPLMTNLKKVK